MFSSLLVVCFFTFILLLTYLNVQRVVPGHTEEIGGSISPLIRAPYNMFYRRQLLTKSPNTNQHQG